MGLMGPVNLRYILMNASCRVCRTSRGSTSKSLVTVKKRCECSMKKMRKGRCVSRHGLRSRATVEGKQIFWKKKSRPCRQKRKEEPAVRHTVLWMLLYPATVEQFLMMRAAQAALQLAFIQGEICREYGGQYQPDPTAPEAGGRGKEREEWEGDWDKEKAASGWYESATVDRAVDLVWCQKGGSVGGRNPRTPRNGKRTLDGAISPKEGEDDMESDEQL